MKTRCLITLYFALLCNAAFAQPAPCVFEWCSAVLPKTAGEKVTGKDNCGNYCSKHGIAIETAPTAPPVAPAPEIAKPAIAQPAKDLLGQAAISVTLAMNEKNEPILRCECPMTDGLTEWDYRLYSEGYRQKANKVGGVTWIRYEKP